MVFSRSYGGSSVRYNSKSTFSAGDSFKSSYSNSSNNLYSFSSGPASKGFSSGATNTSYRNDSSSSNYRSSGSKFDRSFSQDSRGPYTSRKDPLASATSEEVDLANAMLTVLTSLSSGSVSFSLLYC